MSPRAFDRDRLEHEGYECEDGHYGLDVFSPLAVDPGTDRFPIPTDQALESRHAVAALLARSAFVLAPEFADLRLSHRCGSPDVPYATTCGVQVSPQVLDPASGLDDYVSLWITHPPGQARRWWARTLEVVRQLRHADANPGDQAARLSITWRQYEFAEFEQRDEEKRRRRLEQQELAQPPPTSLALVKQRDHVLHRNAS